MEYNSAFDDESKRENESPLPHSNSSTSTQMAPTGIPNTSASSRTATTSEFTAEQCQIDIVGKSQLKAQVVRADAELVTTLALNLPTTPDCPRQTFDEIEKSKIVRINQCTLNDVGGHQVEINFGTSSTSRPGIVPHSPVPRIPPAYPTDPSTRRMEYTHSRISKVNGDQITVKSSDDKTV